MNKFNIGEEVVFEGELGVIVATDSVDDEYEYAVQFSEKNILENLFGCLGVDWEELIPVGYGAWIPEEELEAAE